MSPTKGFQQSASGSIPSEGAAETLYVAGRATDPAQAETIAQFLGEAAQNGVFNPVAASVTTGTAVETAPPGGVEGGYKAKDMFGAPPPV